LLIKLAKTLAALRSAKDKERVDSSPAAELAASLEGISRALLDASNQGPGSGPQCKHRKNRGKKYSYESVL